MSPGLEQAAGLYGGGSRRRRQRSVAEARALVDILVRVGDVAVVLLSGLLASALRFDAAGTPDVATIALLVGALLAAYVLPLLKLYEVGHFVRLGHQLPRLLAGWAVTILGVVAVLFALKSAAELSRLWIVYWFLLGALGFGLWRVVLNQLLQRAHLAGRLRRRLVVVGAGGLLQECLERLERHGPELRVAGALALDGAAAALPHACARIPALAELEAMVREVAAEEVVLALPLGHTAETLALMQRLKHLPVEISLYPGALGAGLPVFGLSQLGDAPLMQLMKRPMDGGYAFLKGVEDRVLAALLLAFLSPLLLAVAALVKLTSPGPVFYRQLRHGFAREPIGVLKFRSMYADDCDAPDAREVRQAVRGDPRVTPLGRVLRQTSLDELPQLLNVLRGEMSLVGPRPHALAHDSHYGQLIDDYLARHRVKPGITGWAQVNGCRGETRTIDEMRRRIELDLEYIDNWSLLLDARILLRTVFVGLRMDHAY